MGKSCILVRYCLAAVLCLPAAAQSPEPPTGDTAQDEATAEKESLQRGLIEAGTSPVDVTRVLENHLEKYPESAQRNDVEGALVKVAIDTDDEQRIVLYGERVLAREQNNYQLLDRVTRALLSSDSKENAGRALKYAQRYKTGLEALRREPPPFRVSKSRWREETTRGLARALVLEARATGVLGRHAAAVKLAEQSFKIYPSAEAAGETARWLAQSGKEEQAVQWYAGAFAIPDGRITDAERAAVRVRIGELYRKLKGSEKGLGDLLLDAYDRTNAQITAFRLSMREGNPNANTRDPMKFTLSGLNGEKLDLSSLDGKVVVLDFWATWCGPCRVQQPLFEEVKRRFKDRPEVEFLAISTDEDRDVVSRFLSREQWDKRVFFEDGLASALRVSSIPTTIVINKRGKIVSRMDGFIPERFADMLSERIQEALD